MEELFRTRNTQRELIFAESRPESNDRDRGGGGAGRAIAQPLLLLGFI